MKPDEIIEVMALGITPKPSDPDDIKAWETFFPSIKRSVEKACATLTAKGLIIVPLEPTYQMCEAGQFNWEGGFDNKPPPFPERYRAMLSAYK